MSWTCGLWLWFSCLDTESQVDPENTLNNTNLITPLLIKKHISLSFILHTEIFYSCFSQKHGRCRVPETREGDGGLCGWLFREHWEEAGLPRCGTWISQVTDSWGGPGGGGELWGCGQRHREGHHARGESVLTSYDSSFTVFTYYGSCVKRFLMSWLVILYFFFFHILIGCFSFF